MRHILAVPLLALWAMAAVPSFMEPVILEADGATIDVGVISDPFMTDWDGDGVTDLLVGQFSPGKVRYYRNIGSNQNPEFTFSGYLQADGADISVSYG